MPGLEDAIALAVEAHRGQVDRAGLPYVLHPLRVMLRLESETERIVAMLHDVVEDTSYDLDRLRALGYTAEVLEAVNCLSRLPGESYPDFIGRVVVNPLAARVKLADLADNLDVGRLAEVTAKDFERLNRYLLARARLRASLLPK